MPNIKIPVEQFLIDSFGADSPKYGESLFDSMEWDFGTYTLTNEEVLFSALGLIPDKNSEGYKILDKVYDLITDGEDFTPEDTAIIDQVASAAKSSLETSMTDQAISDYQEAVEDALEKHLENFSGFEYEYLDDNTNEFQTGIAKGIISTNVLDGNIEIEYDPDLIHVINAMLSGYGMFGTLELENASAEDIIGHLHQLSNYYEIYGDNNPLNADMFDNNYQPNPKASEWFQDSIEDNLDGIKLDQIPDFEVSNNNTSNIPDENESTAGIKSEIKTIATEINQQLTTEEEDDVNQFVQRELVLMRADLQSPQHRKRIANIISGIVENR